MTQDILADVEREGSDPFAAMEDTPSESLTEKQTTDETSANEEDNIPFHKHPRWIERENELKELKERDEANAREIAELRSMTEPRDNTGDEEIPNWFSELYGDNLTAWKAYSQHEQARTEEIENRILARQQQEAEKAIQEQQKWANWVEDEIKSLEAEGLKFDRNKLSKIMLDYSPTDADNNLDFHKGYAIYEALEGKPDNATSEARKQLADTTTTTSIKGEPVPKDYVSSAEIRNRSWGSL
jgi:hypothetical protein